MDTCLIKIENITKRHFTFYFWICGNLAQGDNRQRSDVSFKKLTAHGRTKVVQTQRETRPVKHPLFASSARKPLFGAVSETIVISAKLHPQSELINDVGDVSASHHSSILPPID
jgi:hypothetical protein